MEEQAYMYSSASGILAALMATMGLFSAVIGVAWVILNIIAKWKIFKKAGKPGWHSIIPFLSSWDLVDLSWNSKMAWVCVGLSLASSIIDSINRSASGEAGNSTLTTITFILAIIALVIGIISELKLAKAFGKGTGFGIGLILLNPIFMMILGFGSARYLGRQE